MGRRDFDHKLPTAISDQRLRPTCRHNLLRSYIIFFTGGPVLEGGKQLVVKSNYLAFACAGYAALTFMVWLNANGKFPAGLLAWSLLVWVVLGLWVPAFYLMVGGALPF